MKIETKEISEKKHQHHPTCGCVLPGGNIRRRVQIFFPEPTLTQQAMAEETDINTIVKKARIAGSLPQRPDMGVFTDTTKIPDYQTALNVLNQADEAFASLPSDVRLKFQNNPAELLTFISNPSNYAEAVEIGLIQAKSSKEGQTPPKSKASPLKTNPDDKQPPEK